MSIKGRVEKLERARPVNAVKPIVYVAQAADGQYTVNGRSVTDEELAALREAGHMLIIENRGTA